MAYFNHAFRKVFIGTGNGNDGNTGFVGAGVNSVDLANTSTHGTGSWGLFDPDTYVSVNNASTQVTNGQPLLLIAASLYSRDQLSPFIGGLQESNKSKKINPKYVSDFYRVNPCQPQADLVHIGNTNYTSTLSPEPSSCCFQFLCGETYYLRIDIKGSPALRFVDRNVYRNIPAYTGCCPGPAPTDVDSTLVMIAWGNEIVNDPYLKFFIAPIVFDETGAAWYPPGSTLGQTWDTYVSPGHTTGACAGLRLQGAYVDTKFGNCSFQVTDFFEKEPIKILASMVDLNGDPCVFEGICVIEECPPRQGMGFGEQVLRDLILSERYLQNWFHSDIRIREITETDQILNAVNRNALYYHYFILHSVPRFNNPTGVFDNDRYLLDIITTVVVPNFETIMGTWLTACCTQVSLVVDTCTACTPVPVPVPIS